MTNPTSNRNLVSSRRGIAVFENEPGMISLMTGRAKTGRPSLGDRVVMTAKLPNVVREAADTAAHDHKIDRCVLLAEIVSFHYGRPDLMRHLPQRLLFETQRNTTVLTFEDRQLGQHVPVKPPPAVAEQVREHAERLGIPRSALLADIISQHLGYPELVRELDTPKEGLPLAM
ncbi:hypothetical protein [Mycolicibacterium mucogenicum]|uniref:hypothetical protein n=2 Tax=Mycobacteriaceae TaxID=1762 RepID=UPI001F3940A1|nr:hypothetical protein [Mycolicibacterium mucogenicum]